MLNSYGLWWANIIGNFGSVWPENESTFPFQYNIIFETYQTFEPPTSTPGEDRQVRPLTFLYEINSQQLLFEQFFYTVDNFISVQAQVEAIEISYVILYYHVWSTHLKHIA